MTLSNTATAQVFQQEGGGFLALLVINHVDLPAPLRFVANTVGITSNGFDYLPFPFKVTLPEASDGTPPRAQLVIDNVSREIGQLMRSIELAPTVAISLVRIDSLNTVEVVYPVFKLSNVEFDVFTVTGDLTLDDITKEPFPQRNFTPSEWPALFVG